MTTQEIERLEGHSRMLGRIGCCLDPNDFPHSEATTFDVVKRVVAERNFYKSILQMLGTHGVGETATILERTLYNVEGAE